MTDTEIVLTGGERLRVEGDAKRAENVIVSAARGSILELAWLTEARTRRRVGLNPDHVLMIRALDDVDVDTGPPSFVDGRAPGAVS